MTTPDHASSPVLIRDIIDKWYDPKKYTYPWGWEQTERERRAVLADLAVRLGLDPDMTMEELQRRIKAGTEVVRIHDAFAANGLGPSPVSYLLGDAPTPENSETPT